MKAILTADPESPSRVDPGLPDELDDVLLTALAKDKADRYESVIYLRDALGPLVRAYHTKTGSDELLAATRRVALGALGLGAVGGVGWTLARSDSGFGLSSLPGGSTTPTTAPTGTTAVDDAPMFSYDPANTGVTSVKAGPKSEVTQAWTFETGDAMNAPRR